MNSNKKALFILISFLALPSCSYENTSSQMTSSINYSKDEQNNGSEVNIRRQKSDELGVFIDDKIEAFASSAFYSPENVINCSGMTGNGSYTHKHTYLDPRNNMFITQANQNDNFLILRLNSIRKLGKAYFWNYNNFVKIDCAVKEFSIEYSSDGYKYSILESNLILDRASGKEEQGFSKINGKDYIDFEGVCAKYIKINFISNYGGNAFGLSEIRLFQYKNKAEHNSVIVANIFKEKNKKYYSDLENICNGASLDNSTAMDAKGSNNPYYMHASSTKEIILTLNGNYPLKNIAIWNYNDPYHLDYGIKDIEIYTSINGKDYKLAKELILNKGTGLDKSEYSNLISLDNVHSQYVKLVYKSNYGGKKYGISDIRFQLGTGFISEINQEITGLFSNYNGWTGSDGIFMSSLDGNQSIGNSKNAIINFSDTYVGEVNPVSKLRQNYVFMNNTFASYKNGKVDFITQGKAIPIIPEKIESRSSANAFNWLGDSFVIGDNYYVCAHYIATEGSLGFAQKGEDLIKFKIENNQVNFDEKEVIIDQESNKLSYIAKDKTLEIFFGSAIFENTTEAGALNPDEYIYNFGYRDDINNGYRTRSLVASRVNKNEVENFNKYQYYSSEGWIDDISQTKPLILNVSCEMSIAEINDEEDENYGKFVLTYQKETISNEVCMAISDNLVGEYKNNQTIYSTPELFQIDGVSQYNAKMHPIISNKNEYIVSYNVNETGGSNANITNGDIYHPRFLTIKNIK